MRQINDIRPAGDVISYETSVHRCTDKEVLAGLLTAGVLKPASSQLGRCRSAEIVRATMADEVISRELETSKHARSFSPLVKATPIAQHKP